MPKPDLEKWAVIWYCHDEPEFGMDLIKARDSDTAIKIVRKLRPYVDHVEAWYPMLDEFRDFDRDEAHDWKEGLQGAKESWRDVYHKWADCET